MKKWMGSLMGAGAALGMVGALSVPTFAASKQEPTKSLTIDYVSRPISVNQKGKTTEQYKVKVSGLKYSSNGHYLVGFRYGNIPTGTNKGDDRGTQVQDPQKLFPVTSAGSQVFTIDIPAGKNQRLDVAEYGSPSGSPGETDGKEIREESPAVSLGTLPYGQLPEVPYAAALPLIVGAGAIVLWRRRRA